MRDLLIFDFDGTLVDTIVDVGLSFNEALDSCGFPGYPLLEYNSFVGGNLETIVARLLPSGCVTPDNVENVKQSYRRIYGQSEKPNTTCYAGIQELLIALRDAGFQLAVNTNKGQQLTEALLNRLFPEDLFDAVVGYDESRPSKPNPYGVDMICSQCGKTRDDAVYIGDGRSDILTAAQAGIPCVFVSWGQGTTEDQRDSRIAALVHSVAELQKVLEGYLHG